MEIIILFGPPGSGKGTQAEILKEKYNLIHISTGELFREHMRNNTQLGIKINSLMNNGSLVPDDLTIDMLKDEMGKYENVKGFILDGFPRTKTQAISLENYLNDKELKINNIISLNVPENVLIKRILDRGKTSGRSDDTNEIKIKHRLNEYNDKTLIIKEYFNDSEIFHEIDGVGDKENINNEIIKILEL